MMELFESRMAENKRMQENSTFIEILKENWLQARHIDTIRTLLTIAYVVLFAAVMGYVTYRGPGNMAADKTIVLFLLLLVISAVWLGLTVRLNNESENYLSSIKSAFVNGKIVLGEKNDWWRYMGMPLAPTGRITKWFAIGNLLVLFYSAVGLASLVVIIVAAV